MPTASAAMPAAISGLITEADLHRVGAGDFNVIGVEEVFDFDFAACNRLFEDPGQRIARFHGAGNELRVLLMDRPQPVFYLLAELGIGIDELRAGARLGLLGHAQAAGADAFERAGSIDKDKVRDALASTDMTTMYGPIKFDPTGKNIAKSMVLYQVIGGKYKVVAPTKWAETKIVYPAPDWSERK